MLSLATTNRILDPHPVDRLDDHVDAGGGAGLRAAVTLQPGVAIDVVRAAGLRGRGGAGFPTADKWASVAAAGPGGHVVVNAAEGEPGSFKDRALLLANPFRVLEGALIAADAVGATAVTVVTKGGRDDLHDRLRSAIAEIEQTWMPSVRIEVVEGPSAYLLGEETALLETLEGRPPFPRIAPPYQQGLADDTPASTQGERNAAPATPPTLVNNVETLAHVAWIFAEGPAAFRSLGTDESPGTIVVTVSGDVATPAVAEVPMGTSLRTVLDEVGGGVANEAAVVLNGVSHRALTVDDLDTPLTWEAMDGIGSGLGASGFIVFDRTRDPRAIAAGVARFLAVESCGQCRPCKHDGMAIADQLVAMPSAPTDDQIVTLDDHLEAVTEGARCALAGQTQTVVRSLLDIGAERDDWPGERIEIAPIVAMDESGAVLDADQARKQPDWSFDEPWNGQSPAGATGPG